MKKEREEIFRLFLNCDRLKFSDIEKALKIRSNMVSYHIEQMQKEKLLEKKGEYYFLTAGADKYSDIFSCYRRRARPASCDARGSCSWH